MFVNYYAVLNLKDHRSSADEIRAAYRKMAKICHPDAYTDPYDKQTHTRFMVQINEAYEVLADPGKRADYDREYLRWAKAQTISRTQVQPQPEKTPP